MTLNIIINHTLKISDGLKQNIYIMKLENDTQVIGGINQAEDIWKKDYEMLIKSGMAREFHPCLTGNWREDKERYINEIVNKTASKYANTKD